MIWLGIYAAGVVIGLILHGIYGSWQDDTLGTFNALIWPLFIPWVLLAAPIKLARFIAEGGLASVDTLPKGQDAKQGLAGTEGSAVAAVSGETPEV